MSKSAALINTHLQVGVNESSSFHTISSCPLSREILQEAIDAGSTLKIDLADGNSRYLEAPERFWRVYEREDEPCVRCGTKIKRIVQGGRSTYYCPKCQRN